MYFFNKIDKNCFHDLKALRQSNWKPTLKFQITENE